MLRPGRAGFETRGFGVIHSSGVRCIIDKSQVSKIAKPGAPGRSIHDRVRMKVKSYSYPV